MHKETSESAGMSVAKERGTAVNPMEALGVGLSLFLFIVILVFLFHLWTDHSSRLIAVIKKGFSLRIYIILTLIFWIATTLIPQESMKVQHTPYQYQYGLFSGWITVYQPIDYGAKSFWFHILHGSFGASVSVLPIFLDSLLIYIGYLLLAALVDGFLNGGISLKYWDREPKNSIK